jgi:hypothetical protein
MILTETLRQQQRAIQRESQGIRAVSRRIDTIERQGGVLPTGVQGGFMRYSHFYPQLR